MLVLSQKLRKFRPIVVPKRRQPTSLKPIRTMTADLARLLAEVQVLREQVQKAEAGRVLH